MDENENMTTQNLWNSVKAVLRGRFIAMQLTSRNKRKIKEPTFSFVDFCYSLPCFFFTYFYPNFYDLFPSTNPGILHFFFF